MWKHCLWINPVCPKEHPIHFRIFNIVTSRYCTPRMDIPHQIIADQHYTDDAGCTSQPQEQQQRQQNHNQRLQSTYIKITIICDNLLPTQRPLASLGIPWQLDVTWCWGGGQTSHRRSLLLRPRGTGDRPEHLLWCKLNQIDVLLEMLLDFLEYLWYFLQFSWDLVRFLLVSKPLLALQPERLKANSMVE